MEQIMRVYLSPQDKPRPERVPKLDGGDVEACLVFLACSQPPEGRGFALKMLELN